MKIEITPPIKGMIPRKSNELLAANEAVVAENCFVGRGDLRAWYQAQKIQTSDRQSPQALFKYSNENGTFYLVDDNPLSFMLSPIAQDQYERLYASAVGVPARVYCNDIDMDHPLGDELVIDGGSESAVARFEETDTLDATVSQDSGQAKSGSYSCKILRSGSGTEDFAYSLLDTDATKVRNGYQCTVECEIYLPSGQTLSTVKIETTDDGTNWTEQKEITTTDSWVSVSFSFTPASSFGVRLRGVSADQNDYFYADDISVKQKQMDHYLLGIPQPGTTKPATNVNTAGSGSDEDRIYAYTFVAKYGEESAPSVISDIVSGAKDDSVVEVSKIENIPRDRQITTMRLYRTAVGSKNVAEFYRAKDFTLPAITGVWKSGASMAFSGEYWEYDDGTDNLIYKCVSDNTTCDPDDATNGVGGSGTAYWEFYTVTDDVTTANMLDEGTVCPSQYYYAPPDDLHSLTRHPAGMAVGASGNTLFFSETYLPHAWPKKSLSLEYDIVGIGVFGSSIVVATEGYPSIVVGDSPDAMKQVPLQDFLPCLSARSITTGRGGVFFVSSEGLVLINQDGAHNMSQDIVTRRQWEDLGPAGINANFYADKFFGFSTNNDIFILDLYSQSFTTLAGKVYASHVNQDDGAFYVVTEGTGTYPIIAEWEKDSYNLKKYKWRSREFVTGLVNWVYARVLIDTEFYQSYLDGLESEGDVQADNEDMINNLTMGGGFADDPLTVLAVADTHLESYTDYEMSKTITFVLYVDGKTMIKRSVSGNSIFKLPGKYKGRRTQIELTGYMPISRVDLATDLRELV